MRRSAAALVFTTGFALLGTACNEDTATGGGGGETPSNKPKPSASRKVDGDAGKTLALGETTALTYKRGSDRSITMEVTAKSVKKGSQSDLDAVKLDAAERSMQPYYVTFDFKNIGESHLEYPGLTVPARLRDSRGQEGKQAITLNDDVKPCPADDPEDFAPKATATQCAVFLLPKDEKPSVVIYAGDYDKEPVFWKAND
ncbi:hypothetical protein [Streptomyces sp. XD-27]|uniref:hypothetical protein n=1 Tax=Streptomyces sp. XD-27 TaxID=3062779 RepID=UPI0026F41DAA|nr:hypothetical protein [Streptomyces sp. XD-27]WKX71669.1 hypothetical protein Q3Y56_18695 [Streptomyces sp. XD-27]